MSTETHVVVRVSDYRHSIWTFWPLWPFTIPIAMVWVSWLVIKWTAIGTYWLFVLTYRFIAAVVIGLYELALVIRAFRRNRPGGTSSHTSDAD